MASLRGKKIIVVGAGLAGSESAYYLANLGADVTLIESKRVRKNEAQGSNHFAELVCTNSLKSNDPMTGHGILKREMDGLGSLILNVAREHAVPAGSALAVDRESFSSAVTQRLLSHPNIKIENRIVTSLKSEKECAGADIVIVATGPLTLSELTETMATELFSPDNLYFYDAIAPIVDADSLDYSKLYFKDRHGETPTDNCGADYLNAPFDKVQYEAFVEELKKGEKTPSKNFEGYRFFESCLPVDLMAERGIDTLRYSCMKPIGLETADGKQPYAVVQLRKENLPGSAYNLVGFQTRLKFPEQKRIFSMIPGLESASFLHYGSVHRNTYLNAPKLFNRDFSLKEHPWLHFAGQITGVEGYTESAASGLVVALYVAAKLQEKPIPYIPATTMLGALLSYIGTNPKPVPTNCHFGLLPEVDHALLKKCKDRKRKKKEIQSERALISFEEFSKTALLDTLS